MQTEPQSLPSPRGPRPPIERTEHCPTCDSAVPAAKFEEIRARLGEERLRAAEAEAHMRQEFEAQVTAATAERDQANAKMKELEAREVTVRNQATAAAEARVRQESEAKVTAAATERDQALTKVKELEAREVTVREQATAAAEARVRQEAEAKVAAATAERDQATGQAKEMETQYQRELAQLRVVLEKDRDSKLIELTAQNHRDREKLQELVNDLTRKLQKKTANDLGDGAEMDVLDALRQAFPTDHISRIGKGQVGADICHKVLHKGIEAGTILVESKNCQRFQRPWVTKLREDQIAGQADYAILATTAFPPDRKELYIDPETDVIVVSPARAVEVAWLVRQLMVRMHCRGLSLEQRIEKRDQLYKYLTSEQYRRETAETSRLTSDLADIDVDEKREHDKVWDKRGRVTSRLRHLLSSMDSEVSAILEQAADADVQQDPST